MDRQAQMDLVDGQMDGVVGWMDKATESRQKWRQIWSESEWGCGQSNVDVDGFGGSLDRVGSVGSQVDRQKDRLKAAGGRWVCGSV